MIHQFHPTWRALRLKDAASIAYLNRMFRAGWYIMPFDIDDVPHFIMSVPIETPKRVDYTNEHQILDATNQPTMTIVVLRKGEVRDRQRAVMLERDDEGKLHIAMSRFNHDEWRPIGMINLEDGRMADLLEQGTRR
jgi:hypothetical protein